MLKRVLEKVTDLGFRERLLLLLIFVLPLERVPTFELGGLTIKLSLVVGSLLIGLSLRRILELWRDLAKQKSFLLVPLLLLIYSLLSLSWSSNFENWLKANLVLGFCVLLFYAVTSVLQRSLGKLEMTKGAAIDPLVPLHSAQDDKKVVWEPE